MNIDIETLTQLLCSGDRKTLSKVITLVESSRAKDRILVHQLFNSLHQRVNHSIIIGITGAPGVGKSSFLNFLLQNPTFQNKQIAVLTIDPSSSLQGGSILGDKTRMQELLNLDNIYIRPSPSKGDLGGMSSRSWETVQVCAHAGFDYIFIETVGIGQSEIEISYLADHVFLLLQPSTGDEIQALKKGIMEVVDSFIVTKSDIDSSQSRLMVGQLKNVLALLTPSNQSPPPIYPVSINDTQSVDPIIESILKVQPKSESYTTYWIEKQWKQWILDYFDQQEEFENLLKELSFKTDHSKIPHTEALRILQEKLIQTCSKK